ncbi:DUF2079 domain-containing protein [Rothia nasimurium]|uniref:DUF2079 domain-containing protein n=1 Tax=Rothia nasimurium TaxID=85336 RepID=UPI003BA14181
MSKLNLPAEPQPGRARALAALLALVVFAVYSTYSYFQWKHYVIPSWDLGIFAQLAKAYANGEAPIVPIKGEGFNLLGDHFHPLTLLLTPFYWLWPSPATLLYVQNGLVALSVYLLVRFAQRIVAPWAALALGAAYALSFGVQQAVSVQFHEVAFALPFLMLSLGYLALTRLTTEPGPLLLRATYWGAPLVFVKEDVGVTVFVLGLVILWRTGWVTTATNILFPLASAGATPWSNRLRALTRSWTKTPGVAESSLLALWGAAWSVLAVSVILPFFNTGGVFDYSDKLDVTAALGDPLGSFAQLFYPWTKTATLGLLLLTGALAWIVSPLALIVLPTIIWRFLSPQEGYWEATWHYNLVLMPMIFMALLDALAKAKARTQTPAYRLGSAPLAQATAKVLGTLRHRAPVLLPALVLVINLVGTASQPLADLANPAFATTRASASDQMKTQVLEAIPAGSSVATDLSVLTYLIPEHTVYWINHSGQPAPDYVIIDLAGSAWGGHPPASALTYATGRYGEATYEHYTTIGTIDIARRVP